MLLGRPTAVRSGGASARSPRRSRRAGLRFFLVFVALSAACDSGERHASGDRPRSNVIVAVFDTTRFDDWSYLTPERGVTPVLDALADDGQRFTSAFTLYPVTVPSHVSLFTGNAVLSSRTPASSPLREERFGYKNASLFTILGRHGYRTFAFSGNENLLASTLEALETVHGTSEDLHERMSGEELSDILRRYGEYVEDPVPLSEEERSDYERNRRIVMGSAENVNAAVMQAMQQYDDDGAATPFFLFVNYNDAHDPYFPPAEYADRFRSEGSGDFNGNLFSKGQRRDPPDFGGGKLSLTSAGLSKGDIQRARELHLAELAYADAQFGELLAWLDSRGLLESTVIVGVADHGELFGEHGRMSHGGYGAQELLHIPMFIRFPGEEFPPAIIEDWVDLRDIKPTLLAYLGIEDDTSTGRNLLPMIADAQAAAGALEEPAAVPVRDPSALGGENLIEGQGADAHERLRGQLEALGYIEGQDIEGQDIEGQDIEGQDIEGEDIEGSQE
jgi:arylsulfatase A-like enzyme